MEGVGVDLFVVCCVYHLSVLLIDLLFPSWALRFAVICML